ncbi:MAG: hypothetical protein HY709_05650 [Candidatus Latescibacteria bacterium]|nr:hypothetical protein [Candidatus Latescibacterota bacterium]
MTLTDTIEHEIETLRQQVQAIHRQITDKHSLLTLAQPSTRKRIGSRPYVRRCRRRRRPTMRQEA